MQVPMRPEDLRYSKEHEWIALDEEGYGIVGISDYAAGELGDVVYVQLPEVGTQIRQFEKFGEVESVKSVSDLFTPVGGEIVERNEALFDRPELINAEPYSGGWMLKLRLTDPSELDNLMAAGDYRGQVGADA